MHLFGCAGVSRVSVGQGYSGRGAPGLAAVTPLVAERGLSRRAGFSSCSTRAPGAQTQWLRAHGLSCLAACGIFPDQGSNLQELHWQADSTAELPGKVLGRCFYPAIPPGLRGGEQGSIRASLPCFLLTLLSILHQVEGQVVTPPTGQGFPPSHPGSLYIKPGTSGSYFVDDRLRV